MKADSTAAPVTRHMSGGFKGALLSAAVIAALALAMTAGSVFAAKGGGGSGGGSDPSIALASVAGAASIQPTLGGYVTFVTTYPSNVQNPRIEVLCYQGGTLVYGEAGGVSDSFLLGGGGSTWLTNGGAADCTANLYYFGTHAGQQTYNFLASTTFPAGA
jgi:hypothetical protein